MKIKVSELQGAALDWAVAKCEGCSDKRLCNAEMWSYIRQQGAFRYSTDWAQGGPIIDRMMQGHFYFLENCTLDEAGTKGVHVAYSETPHDNSHGLGPTLLVAAMRCYVASKLGDEIDIPDELL